MTMKPDTPRELLPLFYEDHHLGFDGGQSSSSVRIDMTKGIYFFVPNFDARRKAVLWHDIHHLLTEYSAASFLGECEISAWEIASGCRSYWAAFLIDTSGVLLGCYISPRKIVQAYSRGRRTSNLYHDLYSQEEVLNTPVAELKRRLKLDLYPKESKATFKDLVSFLMFLFFAAVYSILSIVLIPFLIVYNLWMFLKKIVSRR